MYLNSCCPRNASLPKGWSLGAAHLRLRPVKRRALLTLPLAALVGLEPPCAAAAQTHSPAAAADAIPVERFRFHAGAALLAPAGAGSDGSVCVGTADGYVHALGSDGAFRWSHSVRGAVTRRPILARQLWLIATSAERIYALTPEGTLYWVFKPPSPVASELAADATDLTYFIGADRFLYGVSARGGVALRAAFGALKAGPSTRSDGAVWAKNQAGSVLRVRGQELRRMAPEATPEFDFGPPDTVVDPDGHEWRTRSDGVLEFRRAPSLAPHLLELTRAPLLAPSWSPAHYALISARDGLVVALAPTSNPQGP